MPRTFFFFKATPVAAPRGAGRWRIQSIDPTTDALAFAVKDAKKKQNFKITPCVVPGDLIFDVLTSNLLTPFDLAAPLRALLPIRKDSANLWQPLDPVALASKGVAVQNVFKEICNALGTRATLADLTSLINVRNKLAQQVITPRSYLVLTGAGGGRVCCAFAATDSFDLNRLVIDQTLYWAQVPSEEEAVYLAGLLNSEAISSVIKDFQPKGAFGERHVHKLPFGVTPRFDPSQAAHQDVVDQTRKVLDDYAHAKLSDPQLRRLLDPNAGSLAQRRRGIQQKFAALPSYADYTAACRSLYGL
jgi:hypothetical protein